jgi:hypothetical protein
LSLESQIDIIAAVVMRSGGMATQVPGRADNGRLFILNEGRHGFLSGDADSRDVISDYISGYLFELTEVPID